MCEIGGIMSAWLLGGALLVGFVIGLIYEARQSINRVTRERHRDEAEADATFRRRVVYEADRYNEASSRAE